VEPWKIRNSALSMHSTTSLSTWSLHPPLAQDTAPVGDLALSRVLASRDATYPWVILVPRRADVVEIIDLDEADRTRLMAEIARVSEVLKQLPACDKLNVAAIGNVVPQLHVHIVARRRDDPAWPRPVWGAAPPRSHADGELERFIAALRGALAIA
jgi:diadenosine tetraphosphate (Ap4A) HIT family hydrolase